MSADSPELRLYEVSYSGRVLRHILELSDLTRLRGDGEAYLMAVREFHQRLRVYPQFGDPLTDLRQGAGQIRVGILPP